MYIRVITTASTTRTEITRAIRPPWLIRRTGFGKRSLQVASVIKPRASANARNGVTGAQYRAHCSRHGQGVRQMAAAVNTIYSPIIRASRVSRLATPTRTTSPITIGRYRTTRQGMTRPRTGMSLIRSQERAVAGSASPRLFGFASERWATSRREALPRSGLNGSRSDRFRA